MLPTVNFGSDIAAQLLEMRHCRESKVRWLVVRCKSLSCLLAACLKTLPWNISS